jgi:hypothetical protein
MSEQTAEQLLTAHDFAKRCKVSFQQCVLLNGSERDGLGLTF